MRYLERIEKLRQLSQAQGARAFLVSKPQHLRYLSGFSGGAGYLLILPDDALLLSDFRFALQAAREAPQFPFVKIEQDIIGLAQVVRERGVENLGLEADHVTLATQASLVQHLPGVRLEPCRELVESLRLRKDEDEIQAMREAAAIAAAVMERAIHLVRPGSTEREIAIEIEHLLRLNGADAAAFDVIVAAGPNSALPHARPSEREMQRGDLVILDLGARLAGYHSDLTRTVGIGRCSDGAREIYSLVLEAQKEGLAACRPGQVCAQVDAAARSVVERAGKGENFGHGLGHGVGLEIHEAPRLSRFEFERVLDCGMIITVEPGVYLLDLGGVRIEEMVLITETGGQVLTPCPKAERLPEV